MTSQADQLFEDAAAPLDEEFFGTSIVYSRSGVNSAPLIAIAETTAWPLLNDQRPHTTIAEARDYSIRKSVLIVGGVSIEPAIGDKITETINGQSQVFEVLPPPDRPSVEVLPGGFRWLVHTKRVG